MPVKKKADATAAASETPAKPVTKAPATKPKRRPAAAKPKTMKKASGPDLELVEPVEDGGEEADAAPAKKTRARTGRSGALVIVESPAKAKTIKKYLGAGYVVKASVGHVKDLPKKKMGIDIEKGFQPEYVVIDGKKKVLAEIKEAAKRAEKVFLAPDPDREGEAIAWHIAEEVRDSNPTSSASSSTRSRRRAFESGRQPLELDDKKFESQQARRVLDRLVGYQISPCCGPRWRGLSAGRVQSVAVRLMVEREREI